MKIIYVHGLDSSAQSVKGQLLETYCQQHYPNIEVLRPDLNLAPQKVFKRLCDYVNSSKDIDENVILMGSSLGGYFSSLVSNETGCMAVLLNPSTQPHVSLRRFMEDENTLINSEQNSARYFVQESPEKFAEAVIYRTAGGWDITYADLHWFEQHELVNINHPNKVLAVIKEGDELLNPKIAIDFYQSQGANVIAQKGGDHRMTDFAEQLPLIFQHLERFVNDKSS